MATIKPYRDKVKDTIIDALKANLKGVIVLNSVVENEEDEILGNNNSNKPCDNSVSSGQDNISNIKEKLKENVEEGLAAEGKGGSDQNSVDVMGIVMQLNGDE
ncbi:hypothetical protein KY290_005041 [Solanum tuberosum]|uniref:Uncharacterized protein n=1 Tax=Solanum tuberosum TaxID=4113 RepID=A0ABQ7WD16_SOLTU|nr:hypothetical protein KY289_005409 [Solanum tuberosum]KAH0778614.1 hypothetical protein KY290_005041 [Solanum tuberosum]